MIHVGVPSGAEAGCEVTQSFKCLKKEQSHTEVVYSFKKNGRSISEAAIHIKTRFTKII